MKSESAIDDALGELTTEESRAAVRMQEMSDDSQTVFPAGADLDSSEADAKIETCDGCQALRERVDKLEAEIKSVVLVRSAPMLDTTSCYWTTVGIHCLLFMIMAAGLSTMGITIYAFLAGAVGSLATCHVFPVRSVLQKLLRTLLTTTLVTLAASMPLMMQMGFEVGTLFQVLLVYIPFTFLPAWLACKIFAWSRGWLIVIPGKSPTIPKMKISDLIGVTTIVAVYFGGCRLVIDPDMLAINSSVVMLFAAVFVVALITSLAIALFARGFLSQPQVHFKSIFGAIAIVLGAMTAFSVYFIFANGDLAEWPEILVYLYHAAMSTLLCMLSPFITFMLMRAASYQLCRSHELKQNTALKLNTA